VCFGGGGFLWGVCFCVGWFLCGVGFCVGVDFDITFSKVMFGIKWNSGFYKEKSIKGST
jgi:hypothetical protein